MSEKPSGFTNRDRREIMGQILSTVSKNPNIKRTKLLYSVYLSTSQLDTFATEMIKSGLLTTGRDERTSFFNITPKGEKYNKLWSELMDLIKDQSLP